MTKVDRKTKQNPKLVQSKLKDGRASLALEYYLGRSETPVLDENGRPELYHSGECGFVPGAFLPVARGGEYVQVEGLAFAQVLDFVLRLAPHGAGVV